MGALVDLSGQKFGRLTVLRRGASRGRGSHAHWVCECECGGITEVASNNLRQHQVKSCGCLASERASEMGANPEFIAKRAAAIRTHGAKPRSGGSPEYRTWLRIKSRCYRPTDGDYANWGGRGIKVCNRWLNSFEAFREDMGPKPSPRHQIDRLDPNGDYAPDNCRWVTPDVQASENRRNITAVVIEGVEYPNIAAAARALGLSRSMVYERTRSGLTPEEALSFGRWGRKADRPRESYLPKHKR